MSSSSKNILIKTTIKRRVRAIRVAPAIESEFSSRKLNVDSTIDSDINTHLRRLHREYEARYESVEIICGEIARLAFDHRQFLVERMSFIETTSANVALYNDDPDKQLECIRAVVGCFIDVMEGEKTVYAQAFVLNARAMVVKAETEQFVNDMMSSVSLYNRMVKTAFPMKFSEVSVNLNIDAIRAINADPTQQPVFSKKADYNTLKSIRDKLVSRDLLTERVLEVISKVRKIVFVLFARCIELCCETIDYMEMIQGTTKHIVGVCLGEIKLFPFHHFIRAIKE